MKKFSLILVLMISTVLFTNAQQRLCLLEEFTQASCPPCAAQNPALNTLLDANAAKVVSIKYQTNWPGTDPMNAQNPTDVATRVAVYGTTGVPEVAFDGAVLGAPSALTTAGINAEYAVPSPLEINLSHTISADGDSFYVSCEVVGVSALSSTALKLQLAMVEKEIIFSSAPGSNGETEFYSVMRKMYPNASGTTLGSTWAAGTTSTFTFSGPIPAYIYNKAQIAFVAFVQDATTKNVKQAAVSEPIPILVDGAIASFVAAPSVACVTSFTPQINLKNTGLTTMTSAVVQYLIDGTTYTYNYSGSLASAASTLISLPTVTLSIGSHVFKYNVINVNGAPDVNITTPITQMIAIAALPAAPTFAHDFVAVAFPPVNAIVTDPNSNGTWVRAASGAVTTGSATLKYYDISSGVDDYILPTMTLVGKNAASLKFDVAYAAYSATFFDGLRVMVSTDCGVTWTEVFFKEGADLATAPIATATFTPTAAQWRNEVVNLNAYAGNADVMVKLQGESGFGNNIYIDNINMITGTVGIADNELSNAITIYPNPTNGNVFINNNGETINTIEVLDATGKTVKTFVNESNSINVSNLANGTYMMKFTTNNGIAVKRLTITK